MGEDNVVITYETLFEIFRREKNRGELQKLDDDFLMEDKRDSSLDSRSFGPVEFESVVGKVWIRGLPLERLGTALEPDYGL